MSRQLGTNPKDLIGVKKVSITKFPQVALIYGARAMMDGAEKYGPYNWRQNAVVASIYVDALLRHIAAWYDQREENAEDSGIHHLGHAMACLGIILDARETGNLIDDRPEDGAAATLLKKLNAEIANKQATSSPVAPKPGAIINWCGHKECLPVQGYGDCKLLRPKGSGPGNSLR